MAGVWTNNLQGMKNAFLIDGGAGGIATLITTNGGEYTGFVDGTWSPMHIIANGSSGAPYLRFGTGDTPPTAADYKLENRATAVTNVSYTNSALQRDLSTGTVTRTSVISIRNTSENPVTLREWGIYYITSSNSEFMFYREVMDTPVTLDGYQGATITLTRTLTLTDPI